MANGDFITGMLVGQSTGSSIDYAARNAASSAAGAAIVQGMEIDKLKVKIGELRHQNRCLRAEVAGYKDIRKRLHDALTEVAPNHPLADWEEQRRIGNNTIDEEWKKSEPR